MSLQRFLLVFSAVLLLLLLVVFMAGGFDNKVSPELKDLHLTVPENQGVEVVIKNKKIYEPIAATIAAKETTLISSRILARILEVYVRAGDRVKKGDVLIRLENEDLNSQVNQAQQRIKALEAQVTQATLQLTRIRKLHENGLVAIADLDNANATYSRLVADLKNVEHAYQVAKTAVSFSEILAPIDGRIIDRLAEPGDTASPSVGLLSLYNPLSLRVEAAVREQLAIALTLGQEVNVEIPALGIATQAQIDERIPAADAGSRSFLVHASMPFDSRLLPGMYARLLLPQREEQWLLIPEESIKAVGQINLVWVNDAGHVQRRFVRLSNSFDEGYRRIKSGLKPGERVLSPAPEYENW